MDPRQVEVVVQFAKFLELMSDPDGTKQMIKDANKFLADQKEILGTVNTKAKADALLKETEAYCVKQRQEVESMRASFLEEIAVKNELLKQSLAEAAKQKEVIMQIKANVTQAETEANSFNKKAKEKLEELLKREEDNRKLAADLAQKENELQEKADKLKQLLG